MKVPISASPRLKIVQVTRLVTAGIEIPPVTVTMVTPKPTSSIDQRRRARRRAPRRRAAVNGGKARTVRTW